MLIVRRNRLSAQQQRVMDALVNCRTAALGGFKAHCDHCGAVTIQYVSCRNRHCPKCQTLSQTRWVERQCADLLDIDYWHVVFTLPHDLNPVAQGNPALIYRLIFKAASQTLLEFGRNPRWLGGELGITMVLHTWGQNLGQHIHVHCIVTGGALSPDQQSWIAPRAQGISCSQRPALSKVFRGKYLDFLTDAHRKGELRMPGRDGLDGRRAFECLKTSLRSNNWVVYTKGPVSPAPARCWPISGATPTRPPSATTVSSSSTGSTSASGGATTPTANKAKVMRLDADEFHPPLPPACAAARLHPAAPLRIARQSFPEPASSPCCRAMLGQPDPETARAGRRRRR